MVKWLRVTKRPVSVRAFRWNGESEGLPPRCAAHPGLPGEYPPYITVDTLEGLHHASVGDYIVEGVRGELYPVRADIFHDTYVRDDKEEW